MSQWPRQIPTAPLEQLKGVLSFMRIGSEAPRYARRDRGVLERDVDIEMRLRLTARSSWRPQTAPGAAQPPWWPLDEREQKAWDDCPHRTDKKMRHRYAGVVEVELLADGQHSDGLGAKAQLDRLAELCLRERLVVKARGGMPMLIKKKAVS